MTEYTTDPEAIAHYQAARARTAKWVDSLTDKALAGPSVPPSLVSDTDDGLSSQDSDAESSHSTPPRMVLRYPDGRPDVAVSGNTRWPPQGQKPSGNNTSSTFHARSRPGSHGHHPSNPNINSRAPSNAAPLYVVPPAPPIATHPETIHIRPSPTSPTTQQSPDSYFSPPASHNPPPSSRSRSMRSSRPPLQMIYAPPPVPSSHSHSAPVSPTHEGFQHSQQPPPPLPQPGPPIVAPSPVYGFPSASSPHEPPQVAPPTNSRTHSRTHSYSSNHSYPYPPAPQLPNPGPPSSYHSGSAQRPHRHSSRARSSSHPDAPQLPHLESQSGTLIGSGSNGTFPTRRHAPPSIVYAPSMNSSSYAYNPPLITPHPPMTIHAPVPHHAHAQRMAQSISDPTPVSGSLGRNSTRGRLVEDFSRTPSPGTARARAKESKKKDKSRKDRSRRKRRDRGDADDDDDGASFSSGSTYYVIPGPGQKIKVVPPASMKGLYAEPTSASKSTPVLQSHRSPNGPYPPQPPPPQSYKRSLLQRIFHPQFVFGSNANATYGSSSSRRSSRR